MCRLHVAKLFPVSHSMIWKDVSEVRIHIYIQLLRVPVCCWVCRRTLTDFDLVTMCTFNHYVCLSAVAFAGEHWLWHWPGDHVYIQPFSVPVCCCVCRRTLTVTLTWWPCVHSTFMCTCLLLRLQENIDCDIDLVTMYTFNHYVCLSAVAFAGEHWLWLWPGDQQSGRSGDTAGSSASTGTGQYLLAFSWLRFFEWHFEFFPRCVNEIKACRLTISCSNWFVSVPLYLVMKWWTLLVTVSHVTLWWARNREFCDFNVHKIYFRVQWTLLFKQYILR